ncbi:uncharacterized protein [Procambarus clarkii]|uniref:uncharacterized protein n=1 Tax=Procambarus clarkii TaxID=6728 RepID=UPI001E670407|nr:uncharacterized protein LOC123746756 [Procambarus clarkii]
MINSQVFLTCVIFAIGWWCSGPVLGSSPEVKSAEGPHPLPLEQHDPTERKRSISNLPEDGALETARSQPLLEPSVNGGASPLEIEELNRLRRGSTTPATHKCCYNDEIDEENRTYLAALLGLVTFIASLGIVLLILICALWRAAHNMKCSCCKTANG